MIFEVSIKIDIFLKNEDIFTFFFFLFYCEMYVVLRERKEKIIL